MEYVEVARARTARGEVVLRERRDPDTGSGVELRVNGVFVMDTVETSSERGLARAALARVAEPRAVLVGGLGLGFTAREVLADRRVERLVVAEVEGPLVGWMRDGTIAYGPALLADDRLTVVVADVRQVVSETPPASYDLVVLDVDNGPDHLVHEDNAAVYQPGFLRAVRDTLRPCGALVVWSSVEAPALRDAMARVFGTATAIPFDVRLQGRAEQYWVHLAPT